MSSYYDVDAIFTEEEPVEVLFRTKAKGLSYLDQSRDETEVDLPSQAKIRLPVWLTKVLAEKRFVSPILPDHFSIEMRNDIDADATAIDLGELCVYFYEFGLEIATLFPEDSGILQAISNAYISRYKEVIDRSQNTPRKTHALYAKGLTASETKLFQAAWRSVAEFAQWKSSLR